MGFFDFLITKTAKDYYGKTITFAVDKINLDIIPSCKNGDYVNLWTKYDMNNVMIYAPNSGGNGALGRVPSKYSRIIKAHILSQEDYGFSGPSTNNYDATMIDVTGSRCVVGIKLFSPQEHRQAIKDMIEKDKSSMKAELEKKYKMRSPVEIKFDIKKITKDSLDTLQLKVLEKEFYIENPYNYKLHLIDQNNQVIGETFSQKDKIFRVIKGFYNGQKLNITNIKKEYDCYKVLISGE